MAVEAETATTATKIKRSEWVLEVMVCVEVDGDSSPK